MSKVEEFGNDWRVCNCSCHSNSGIVHCVPCCTECPLCKLNIIGSIESHKKESHSLHKYSDTLRELGFICVEPEEFVGVKLCAPKIEMAGTYAIDVLDQGEGLNVLAVDEMGLLWGVPDYVDLDPYGFREVEKQAYLD